MRNIKYFKDKRVTIVGLARSGLACANLLHGLGASVRVTDINDNSQSRSYASSLLSNDIPVELGKHSEAFIKEADLVVISPGVPPDSQPVIWAKAFSRPAISEIEVAGMLCPGQIIAVTGSNGKTTVTTLIGRALDACGKKAFVCGNIGNPFSGEVAKMREGDFAVVEVSSFQLETIREFKPKIALIININPNHLDRYNNMQEYLDAKKRIFMNQDKDDFLVLNAQDACLAGLEKETAAKVLFFSGENSLNPNQSAVLKVGELLGLDRPTILKVLSNFKGLEHRMEDVAEINKVRFINDSKATTADSAIWAINSISSPIVLIAGGRHKGIDYRVIIEAARNKVKHVVLIGEAKERIAACLRGEFPVEMAAGLEEAVNKTYALAKPGDSVLFSPMCSSFDMFRDYEERGRVFKKIVLELSKRNNPTESSINNG